jgi:hypothetical protein
MRRTPVRSVSLAAYSRSVSCAVDHSSLSAFRDVARVACRDSAVHRLHTIGGIVQSGPAEAPAAPVLTR